MNDLYTRDCPNCRRPISYKSMKSVYDAQRKNCSCKHCAQIGNKNGQPNPLPDFTSLYRHLCKCAKKKDVKVELSFEQFVELTKQKTCSVCGDEVIWKKRRKHLTKGFAYNLD